MVNPVFSKIKFNRLFKSSFKEKDKDCVKDNISLLFLFTFNKYSPFSFITIHLTLSDKFWWGFKVSNSSNLSSSESDKAIILSKVSLFFVKVNSTLEILAS